MNFVKEIKQISNSLQQLEKKRDSGCKRNPKAIHIWAEKDGKFRCIYCKKIRPIISFANNEWSLEDERTY